MGKNLLSNHGHLKTRPEAIDLDCFLFYLFSYFKDSTYYLTTTIQSLTVSCPELFKTLCLWSADQKYVTISLFLPFFHTTSFLLLLIEIMIHAMPDESNYYCHISIIIQNHDLNDNGLVLHGLY